MERPTMECPIHSCIPTVRKAKGSMWVAYCPEPNCILIEGHKSIDAALEGWNKFISVMAAKPDTDKMKVQSKRSFEAGIQYMFVLMDVLQDNPQSELWPIIDPDNVFSDEFKERLCVNIQTCLDRWVMDAERSNWSDYIFEEQS